ncbi:hypothetical protein [Priestia megaterium]|uniref:hypothetical protein n=1 Tax=Priestia megaterium TaxID=1404 RepID=UPI002E24D1B5|nr:hypothetical protein [Priestia megaterium]
MEAPEQLDMFMYALMTEARKDSLIDFLNSWGITEKEFKEMQKWFHQELGIKI